MKHLKNIIISYLHKYKYWWQSFKTIQKYFRQTNQAYIAILSIIKIFQQLYVTIYKFIIFFNIINYERMLQKLCTKKIAWDSMSFIYLM